MMSELWQCCSAAPDRRRMRGRLLRRDDSHQSQSMAGDSGSGLIAHPLYSCWIAMRCASAAHLRLRCLRALDCWICMRFASRSNPTRVCRVESADQHMAGSTGPLESLEATVRRRPGDGHAEMSRNCLACHHRRWVLQPFVGGLAGPRARPVPPDFPGWPE